jgi:hypothetical protein
MSKQTETKPGVEEMNRVIAEFMELKYDPFKTDSSKFYIERNNNGWQSRSYFNPLYHSSWDWLKPAIDKIFTYAIAHREQVDKIIKMSIVVRIKAAHEAVYDFITWYNSQNK